MTLQSHHEKKKLTISCVEDHIFEKLKQVTKEEEGEI